MGNVQWGRTSPSSARHAQQWAGFVLPCDTGLAWLGQLRAAGATSSSMCPEESPLRWNLFLFMEKVEQSSVGWTVLWPLSILSSWRLSVGQWGCHVGLGEFGDLLMRRICHLKCGGRSTEQINFFFRVICLYNSLCVLLLEQWLLLHHQWLPCDLGLYLGRWIPGMNRCQRVL